MAKQKNKQIPIIIGTSVLAVGLGLVLGWGLRKNQSPNGSVTLGGGEAVAIQKVVTDVNAVKAGDVFGSPNETDFKDSAQGYLAEGGIGDEGSHHLVRPGGDSQNVYLTSSVTDLDKLVGMEVEVWGETFAGKKAGWLMDVGRVKVINPQGINPNAGQN